MVRNCHVGRAVAKVLSAVMSMGERSNRAGPIPTRNEATIERGAVERRPLNWRCMVCQRSGPDMKTEIRPGDTIGVCPECRNTKKGSVLIGVNGQLAQQSSTSKMPLRERQERARTLVEQAERDWEESRCRDF